MYAVGLDRLLFQAYSTGARGKRWRARERGGGGHEMRGTERARRHARVGE